MVGSNEGSNNVGNQLFKVARRSGDGSSKLSKSTADSAAVESGVKARLMSGDSNVLTLKPRMGKGQATFKTLDDVLKTRLILHLESYMFLEEGPPSSLIHSNLG